MQFPYERDDKQDFQEAQLAETLKVVTLIYEMLTTHKHRVEQETMLRISGWIKIHMISAYAICFSFYHLMKEWLSFPFHLL